MKNRLPSLGLSFALLLAALPAAGWESAYGPPATREQAQRRVASVTGCPPFGAGHIAVGTLDESGADPDLYVVFTDPAGTPYWERRYDVQGLGLPDEGAALAVLPNSAGSPPLRRPAGWQSPARSRTPPAVRGTRPTSRW